MKMTHTLEKSILEEKNKIIVGLRDYLMKLYNTNEYYTFGEEDFEIDEAKRKQGIYCSVRRDPNKPRDLSGFCFRKDLLSGFWSSDKETKIRFYEDIHRFLNRQKNVESKLRFDSGEPKLSLRIENEEYSVRVYVGEGYADEIHVDFMKSFNFESDKKCSVFPLNAKEKKELRINSVKRVEPLLRALDEWSAESLNSNFMY